MIETRAPGKLYIAGEYAVVEPGHPAVLVAVDRCITVRLTAGSQMGKVHSTRYGHGPVTWVRDADGQIVTDRSPYDYVTATISVMEKLRAERGLAPRYFDLHIDSELDDEDGRKFGLGSSAAVTVAVVAALDEFYRMGLSLTERFRIGLLATVEVAPRASGGDVAASTFGGFVHYTSPDRQELRRLAASASVEQVLGSAVWQDCRISQLGPLAGLRLLVGWTGSPASTERLVERVQHQAAGSPGRAGGNQSGPDADYQAFLAGARTGVEELVAAWSREPAVVLRVIGSFRTLLQGLGRLRGTQIETGQLGALCDLAERCGAAAKPSGAGGGDCGIALMPDGRDPGTLLARWRQAGILPLGLNPYPAQQETREASR
ncbi:phosphomevalonate kinase [Acidipropionibacterium jensenii]|uniref:phosphomevalonate kinase n=1 Tax=Acidipropionibacterium jensenii TaxID=1749 RepID=UPI00214AD786|nr:phosphomevalonate kinase [Acidipropionibacterium jensenii]